MNRAGIEFGSISRAALVALAIAPALNPYHFAPATDAISDSLAVGAAALALVGLWDARARPPALCYGLLVLALLAVLAHPLGPAGLAQAMTLAIAGLACWLGASLTARSRHTLVAALALGGALVAVTGFVQLWNLDSIIGHLVVAPGSPDEGIMGTIAQRNMFSDYMGLALLACVYVLNARIFSPLTFALLAAPAAFALGLSESRVAILALAAAIAYAAWCAFESRRLSGWLAIAVMLFGFALGHVAIPAHDPSSVARLVGLPLVSSDRQEVAGIAVMLWKASPVFGAGLGAFPANAHNLVLQLLAETGIAGLAIVLAGLAATLWGKLRTVSLWDGFALAAMGLVLAHSMVEFPLWYPQWLMLCALLAGSLGAGAPTVALNLNQGAIHASSQ